MESSDTARKGSDSGSDSGASSGAQGDDELGRHLAVRWNCKAGKCGSCSMELNGKRGSFPMTL